MYVDPYQRSYPKIAERVGSEIFRHFLRVVMDRLMESDRLVLPDGASLLIARTKKDPKRVVKYNKYKQIYWANRGFEYKVVMHGFPHKYYFRMPLRRRLELRDRINKGQNFTKLD